MAFDKKHYRQCKLFIAYQLSHVSFLSTEKCPFNHAKTFLPLIADCVNNEDFEGAKAVKDAIKEFLNRFLPDNDKILDSDSLNIPEFQKKNIKGMLSNTDGTAQFFNL